MTMKIRIRIDRTRMAMSEPCYAYDGLVSLANLGVIGYIDGCTTICKDGGRFVSFIDATRPAELIAMPLGWDRYMAYLEHEKSANERLLRLAIELYPELTPVAKWPSLWVHIPWLDEQHSTRFIDVAL